MSTYETSISIAAPPDAVWRVLSDVAAWPKWLPTVANVESLDGSPLAVGRRYRVRRPRLQPVTWTVTDLEPARRFGWQASTPGLKMSADHIVSGDTARSHVVLRFSFAGPLGPLMGALYRSITMRYIATEAATLKQKVETS